MIIGRDFSLIACGVRRRNATQPLLPPLPVSKPTSIIEPHNRQEMGCHLSKHTSNSRHSQPKPPPHVPSLSIQRSRGLNLYTGLRNAIAVRSLLSSFPRLPNEILLEIAKSLDTARDLYVLRRVNKRLADLLEHLLSDFLLRAYYKSKTRSLLFSAATHYPESLVQHLSRLGVDLNTIDCDCDSVAVRYCRCLPALHHAVTHSQKAMVRLLLRHGARVNAPCNSSGDNAVHIAIDTTARNFNFLEMPRNKDMAILRMLLSDGVLQTMNDPASLNNLGLTWLNVAARRCRDSNMTIVEPFLSPDLSLDVPDLERSLTPLHAAVWSNNVNVVTALLTLGADHRTVDFRGTSPFGAACNRPNCALIDLLLRHDATLIDEVVNDRGETADLCLQREVERLMSREDPEGEYYESEVPRRQKMLVKLRKLAKARLNSSMTDSLLQIYYNCL